MSVIIWVLVVVTTSQGHLSGIHPVGEYPSMLECFDEREKIVEKRGRPIVDYQAICVQSKMTTI